MGRITHGESVTLPTGKQVVKQFDAHRNLVRELHSYGAAERLDIAISFTYEHGRKTEMYFHKQRLVSRKTYERQRLQYPDMPPAETSVKDEGAELLKLVAREKREHAKAAKAHRPDSAKAGALDKFCRGLMDAGRREDAVKWIQSNEHTLGEMTRERSRKLVEKLKRLGAAIVHVCQIDAYPDGTENSGHLVVELPASPPQRKSLLKEFDRLARQQGYEGDPDDGQQYAYVKLD